MDKHTKAKLFPKEPGIYIFYGKDREYLYIGKAKNLRARLLSYFRTSTHKTNSKIRSLLSEATDIDFTIVSNEREALLLEASLIFEHKPKYNVLLKNAEYYPYVEITADKYPTVRISRKRSRTNSKYFGPYTSVGFIKNLIEFLQQIHLFRTCQTTLSKVRKPCMNFYMHRCLAPCRKNEYIDPKFYQKMAIEPLIEFLNGKTEKTIQLIREKMIKHSRMLDFENAAKCRDMLFKFEDIMARQGVVVDQRYNFDVIARKSRTYVVFRIRGGHVISKLVYELDSPFMRNFLFNFYLVQKNDIPPSVIVERGVKHSVLGDKVYVGTPRDDVELDLLKKAKENVETQFSIRELNKKTIQQMAESLKLSRLPQHIEGIDIAHIQGDTTIGSVVVFKNGTPVKSEYRHYNFGNRKIDDYATIELLVKKRYSKHPVPDLILVDGGLGQLNSVIKALRFLNRSADVVSLAKAQERVFTRHGELNFPQESLILRALVRIRDESHRFANTFHKKLRTKKLLSSKLDQVPGIGPKRKKQIIKAFGSLDRLKNASLSQVAQILKSKKLAERIFSYL